jgi:hypothetical protein
VPLNGSGIYTPPAADFPAVPGTVIESAKFNNVINDIASAISTGLMKDGQSTPTQNIPLGGNKITGLAAGTQSTDAANLSNIQSGTGKFCGTSGGTANAITLSPSPTIAAYAAGQTFYFIAGNSNTGAVTVAVSGLAAKNISIFDDSPLVGHEIIAGGYYCISYNGTSFAILDLSTRGRGVDPEQFGAIGDGVADDTTAFQAAVTAASTTGINKVFATRKYYIGDISIPSGVFVVGELSQHAEYAKLAQNYYDLTSQLLQQTGTSITMAGGCGLKGVLTIREGLSLPATNGSQCATLVSQFEGTSVITASDSVFFDNVLLMGHTLGIDTNASGGVLAGGAYLHRVRGDCTNGINLKDSAEICELNFCRFFPWLTILAYDTAPGASTSNLQRSGTAYYIGNRNDWSLLTGCFSYGYNIGYKLENCSNITLLRCGSDNVTGTGTYSVHMTGATGEYFRIIGGTFIGHPTAIMYDATGPAGNNTLEISNSIIIPTGAIGVDVTQGFVSSVSNKFQVATIGFKVRSTAVGINAACDQFYGTTTPYDVDASVAAASRIDGLSPVITATGLVTTASSGSFTTVATTMKYQLGYKRCDWYDITVTITNNGTAAGLINVVMPIGAANKSIGIGKSNGVGGHACLGDISGANMTISKYDNTYPGATGATITMSGSFEMA